MSGSSTTSLKSAREVDGAGAHARAVARHDERLPQQEAPAAVLVVERAVGQVLVKVPEAREHGGGQLAAQRARTASSSTAPATSAISLGKPSAGGFTFTPMPSTACSKRPDSMSTTPSVRMPATLRPSQIDVVHPLDEGLLAGHLLDGLRARHGGGAGEELAAVGGRSRGRSTTLRYTPAPAGEKNVLPRPSLAGGLLLGHDDGALGRALERAAARLGVRGVHALAHRDGERVAVGGRNRSMPGGDSRSFSCDRRTPCS